MTLNSMEIIPSILTNDSDDLKIKMSKLDSLVERIVIDVADGTLTPSSTIAGFEELNAIETNFKIDVHLMVQNPDRILEKWLATKTDRIFVHTESASDINMLIEKVHQFGKKIGLVLNPETPTERIYGYLDKIDIVQFMTVEPGFQGGQFVESTVEKIRNFHDNYPTIPVCVDGGVNPDTLPRLKEAGASIFVIGSYIWESRDIRETLQKLYA